MYCSSGSSLRRRCSSSRSTCSSIVSTRSGQQPAKAERVALGRGEGEVLGQQPAAEERRPGERDRRRPAGRDGVERGGQWAHRGEHSGRVPRGRGRRGPPRSADRQPPVTTSVPTMPYASWPGRWQMYRYVPGVSNRTVVSRLEPAGIDDLGRARAVDRLGAGPMALVDRGVADDPLVVDRVVVAQHERDRRRRRRPSPAPGVVRVVDADLDPVPARVPARRSRRPRAPARPSERAMPPTRAKRPGRRSVGHRVAPLRPSTAAGAAG